MLGVTFFMNNNSGIIILSLLSKIATDVSTIGSRVIFFRLRYEYGNALIFRQLFIRKEIGKESQ